MGKFHLFLILLSVILLGCNGGDLNNKGDYQSQIVVEGWIEEGDVAQIILSKSVPIDSKLDTITLMDYTILPTKVSVSDGEKEEVLILKTDNNHIPPFIYTGSEIIGQTGKIYTLKIEYQNKIIESTTSIPKSVPIISAEYIKDNPDLTIGYIFIKFEDPAPEKNYYQILTQVTNVDPIFVPSLYGNLQDDTFTTPLVNIQIYRGKTLFPTQQFNPYFNDGDLVNIKLRTMNKDGYDFWNSWQNETINGNSPIFPNTKNLKSNIKGGIGIWQGYGHNTITLLAKP